jgi:hypothetical protein
MKRRNKSSRNSPARKAVSFGMIGLSDILLAKLAGWEVVKQARALLAAGRVLSSEWQPPNLARRRAGRDPPRIERVWSSAAQSDADNLCTCRDARQRGLICAHSVAAGLHFLKGRNAAPAPKETQSKPLLPKPRAAPRFSRARRRDLELFLILPPNFAIAAARGKVMLYIEGSGATGVPLDALPLDTPFSLDDHDAALLDALEEINHGGKPAMLLLESRLLTEMLPRLAGHPRVTLGKTQSIEIVKEPAGAFGQGALGDRAAKFSFLLAGQKPGW